MLPAVAVLVPWDVAICVVTIVHQNANISMSGLGVNCSSAIGDYAMDGGCAGSEGGCDVDVCGCDSARGCKAVV